MADSLYLWVKQSESVSTPAVYMNTVARVYCSDRQIQERVKALSVYHFSEHENAGITISVLYIISLIETEYPDVEIQTLGETSCVVYYNCLTPRGRFLKLLYFLLVGLIALFGAAYSIMGYNTDVGAKELLLSLHEMFIGEPQAEYSVDMLAYSLGLLFGMLLFFNHGILGKRNKEPTPLQVQMREYEQEVNSAVMMDAARKGNMQDVD